MSEDTPTPGDVLMGHHHAAVPPAEQQHQLHHHMLSAPQADTLVQQQPQQQHKFPAQQYAAGGSLWGVPAGACSVTRPHLPQASGMRGSGTAGTPDRHGSPAQQRQHAMHLPLSAAYSRLSVAGDTVADAQRQTDQSLGPAAAAAGGTPGGHHIQQQQAAAAAWAMQRGGAAGQHSCWPAAGPAGHEVDAAKLRAQADQHMQAPALSVEVGVATAPARITVAGDILACSLPCNPSTAPKTSRCADSMPLSHKPRLLSPCCTLPPAHAFAPTPPCAARAATKPEAPADECSGQAEAVRSPWGRSVHLHTNAHLGLPTRV
jgi:hypothetical protein